MSRFGSPDTHVTEIARAAHAARGAIPHSTRKAVTYDASDNESNNACTVGRVAALAVAMATGCSQGTPGGPGAKGKAPAMGQAADTFNLSVPMMAASLQQGGTSEVVVGIVRGMNFDEDVALKFADLPEGVTVEPSSPGIKRGETNTSIAFRAGKETPIGAFKVNVTGRPTKGGDAQADFKLDIVAKDGFSLNLPRSATSLTQGATRSVEIGVDRQKAFADDVSIRFGEFPTGVTAEPSEPLIERASRAFVSCYPRPTRPPWVTSP